MSLLDIAAVITALGVPIMAGALISDRMNAKVSRQTQLFMDLYNRWDDKEFQKKWMEVIYEWSWKDWDEFQMKYGIGNLDAYASSFSVSAYFEGIGVLVKRKLIDLDLVDDLMSTTIKWFWEKTEPIVLEGRRQMNRPQLLEWSEYLYKELKKREEKEKAT